MRIIDLFSGAGGLTFGFYYRIKQNKFVRNRKNSFVFANELDPFAAEAFKANFPDIRMINEDIKQLDKDTIEQMIGEEPVDLIIGGPPCQSFSTVGQRVFDEKATLYEEYLRILSIAKPKIFLFENVKGMLSMRETFYKKDKDGNIVYEVKKNKETGSERKYPVVEGYGRKIIDIIKEKFAFITDDLGYNISCEVLNTVDYGVPENRERVFVVGIRKDLDMEWKYPTAIKADKLSVKDAISDLPVVLENQNITNYTSQPQNEYQRLMRGHNNVLAELDNIVKDKIHTLPECFITGYDLPMSYEKSIADNDIRIAQICENAKKYKIGVVLTAFTKGSKQPQNSAFVINKSGNILMKYSKVHTCDFADERDVESGKEFKVCDFEGIQLGIMICYDREYPESARILMLKGAEVILVPNDCGSMQARIRALSTRAYENMVAVAMANPNGDNAGCSCAYSPICWDRNGKCVDNTVLLADDKTEGIFYAEFDMEAIREYRNREMLGNTFRKVEAYSQLLSKEIKKPFIRDGQNR